MCISILKATKCLKTQPVGGVKYAFRAEVVELVFRKRKFDFCLRFGLNWY